jgi:sensor histidine kinase YesM
METIFFEDRRIKLLNFITYFTIPVVISFIIIYFFLGLLSYMAFIVLLGTACVAITSFFLQKKKRYILARIVFITGITGMLFCNNNFIITGHYGEYEYIIIPLLAILFFDKWLLHAFSLLLSLALFYVPNVFLKIYDPHAFGNFNVIFIFISFFAFVIFFKRVNVQNEKLLLKANKKLELNKNKELEFLTLKVIQSQMSSHFIFNAFNTIQDFILHRKEEDSYDFVVKLSQFFRKNISFSKNEYIKITEEIELMKIYLEIEKMRFKTDFDFEIKLSNTAKLNIPPMLIQPFVENAIKDRLLHKEGIKKININFDLKDLLICSITDNGIERKAAIKIKERQKRDSETFSTSATVQRLNIMKEHYNSEIGFSYEDLTINKEPTGTKVTLKIPYKITE